MARPSSGSSALSARRSAAGVHRSGTVQLAPIPAAWTPASVRPAAWTRTGWAQSCWSTRSTSPWTVRSSTCRCQPANPPPSYWSVTRKVRAIARHLTREQGSQGLGPQPPSSLAPQLPSSLVPPNRPDDHPLNHDVVLGKPERLHGGMGGLEPDPAAGLAVELLDRRLGAVDEGDDHLPVVGALAAVHHDVIAVHDLLVDHGVSPDPERVIRPPRGEHGVRDGQGFLVEDRLDRDPRRRHAEKRELGGTADAARRQHLDGPALVVAAADVALALEIGQVLVHRGPRPKQIGRA